MLYPVDSGRTYINIDYIIKICYLIPIEDNQPKDKWLVHLSNGDKVEITGKELKDINQLCEENSIRKQTEIIDSLHIK